MSHQIIVRSYQPAHSAFASAVVCSVVPAVREIEYVYTFEDLDLVYNLDRLREELGVLQEIRAIACVDCSSPTILRDRLSCAVDEMVEVFLDAIASGPPDQGGVLVSVLSEG